ncbi:MAG: hypothetical protein IT572_08925 [Deltaproteobacteria bacterium]|nr:hypothetical protein [Deltaproteobacteria bacterium]
MDPVVPPPSLLRALMGAENAREFSDIWRENRPSFRAEALLALAGRLEREGRIEAAAELYHAVLEMPEVDAFSRRARERFDALQGQGPLNRRLENLGRRFVAQATDPRMIAAFGVASWVAGMTRLGAGAWLASRGAGLLTRGPGARLTGGIAGFLAEVPAFVGARRILSRFSRTEEAQEPGLGEELASAALFLGVLQLSGFAGSALGRRPGNTPLSRGAWQAGTSLGGVYLGHRLEEVVGLRPARDEASRWVDTADTWLQMQVGGRMMHGVGGMAGARVRYELLLRHGLETSLSPRPGLARPAQFLEGSELPAGYSFREMSGAEIQPLTEPALQRLSQTWGRVANKDSLDQVRRLGREYGDLDRMVEAFELLRPEDSRRLCISLRRLRHMVEHARPIGARGNYLEWLTRWGFTESVRRKDAATLQGILDAIHDGMDLTTFERLLQPIFPQYRMQPMTIGAMRRALQNFKPIHRAINILPMGAPARDLLHRTVLHLQAMDRQDPLHMEMEQFLESLARAVREKDSLLPEIERAMAPIPLSPLPYMRLFRLYRVMAREFDVYTKYRELTGEGLRLIGIQSRMDQPPTVEEVDGTQHNGYFEEPEMAAMFADFNRLFWKFIDGYTVANAAARRRQILRQHLPQPRPLMASDALRILRELGDPVSLSVVDSVVNWQVRLEILPRDEFEAEVSPYVGDRARRMIGVFMPKHITGEPDRILIKQIENFDSDAFHETVFFRIGFVVHEHEHFLHNIPGVQRSRLEIVRQEMRSCHREFEWLAQHGESAWVHYISAEGAAGWAMQLRSVNETWNLKYTDPND